jgi:hypothetical protein
MPVVTSSYSSASVYGVIMLGGFVGMSSGNITGCYSIGTVFGGGSSSSYIGGFVGDNTGVIRYCYSMASVAGVGMVGGFVGMSSGSISFSYSTGVAIYTGPANTVWPPAVFGFFFFFNPPAWGSSEPSLIDACYWDTEASGHLDTLEWFSSSDMIINVTGYPTAEMMQDSTYAGWDFTSSIAYWGISNGYPYLRGLPTDTIMIETETGETVLRILNAGVKDIRNPSTLDEFTFPDITVSVTSTDRLIPETSTEIAAAVQPKSAPGRFTAGPNPASRVKADVVAFFWDGAVLNGGALSVYDANGNFIRRININTPAPLFTAGQIASWDLTDAKGRQVAAGTYLVRGSLTTAGGKSEKVSAVIGVR